MVMRVLLRTRTWRTISALAAILALAGGAAELGAQQQPQQQQPNDQSRRQPQQQTKPKATPQQQRPAAKTPPTTAAPAPKGEPLSPSQVGIPTTARQAFMVDPLTSTVLLYKDADQPMAPSSMAKMMT